MIAAGHWICCIENEITIVSVIVSIQIKFKLRSYQLIWRHRLCRHRLIAFLTTNKLTSTTEFNILVPAIVSAIKWSTRVIDLQHLMQECNRLLVPEILHHVGLFSHRTIFIRMKNASERACNTYIISQLIILL